MFKYLTFGEFITSILVYPYVNYHKFNLFQ